MVGEEGDGEEHDEAGEPAGSLEAVREAEDAGADDGDEDVGEGFEFGGERWGFGEERCVFSRVGWEGVGGGTCFWFFLKHHCCCCCWGIIRFEKIDLVEKVILIWRSKRVEDEEGNSEGNCLVDQV